MEKEKEEEIKKPLEKGDLDILDEYLEFYESFDKDEDFKEKTLFTSLFYFYLKKKGID